MIEANVGQGERGPATSDRNRGRVSATVSWIVAVYVRAAVLVATTLILGGCSHGGNEAPPGAPRIESFTADRTAYFMGETAQLTARFAGGSGRIEPNVGVVENGVPVAISPLDRPTTFRLVVENDGQRVERTLSVSVVYRDRYSTLAQNFRAARHSATLASDGRVILIGGSRGTGVISAAVDRFDPASGGFTRIGTLATGRENHTATLLPDDRVLVVGGNAALNEHIPAELVDTRSGAATPTGYATAERSAHAATALGDGRVLVTGGYSNEGLPYGISNSAEVWDPTTGQFRRLALRMTVPRTSHTATLLADGRVLIAGGFSPYAPYTLAEVFDPATEIFTPVPSPDNRQRALHVAFKLGDGTVLIMGGEDSAGSFASVLRFRANTTSLEVMPNLLRERSLAGAVVTPDDRILLFGGEQLPSPVKLATAEVYVPAAGSFDIAGLPEGRSWHSTTRLKDGRVLIVGGERSGGELVSSALLYE